jgi:MFS family permease
VRYSLQNNPRVFLSALFVATLVLSLLVWAAWFAAAEEPEDVRETRRRLWRWYLRALVVSAIGLAILAVITTVSPGSGHPPAIVLVLILGVWAAGFFVLAATFLLASYPMQLFGRRRRVE